MFPVFSPFYNLGDLASLIEVLFRVSAHDLTVFDRTLIGFHQDARAVDRHRLRKQVYRHTLATE
eukprot:2964151-Amphidinium_carterae.1